ncbi:beta-N-acetylglucosaminidase domain-containing protein [Streptomyces sp. NPDC050738]|uniref:beta-N-acetylglucosaminidase domain-containing protein n=1 Tax=Streptomyces sp. NPDC050738 TaxID=3154744 RepID=UPI00341B9443
MTLRLPRLAALAAALSLLLAVPALPAVAQEARHQKPWTAPAVTPTPQSVQPRGDHATVSSSVTLVTGETADEQAVRITEQALRAAGAQRIVRSTAAGHGGLTVYVGSAAPLSALGIKGPAQLPADGYVLGIGAGRIVLAGQDTTGTYYAAQSLRQVLPHDTRPGATVPGLQMRDWPATPLRGVIEGFYGTPWSHAARLDQLDFYGEHKMNIYVYSPKDDPYLRARWREAYPADQLGQLKELVDRATADHVDFTYALSPGLSVCYSSDADIEALVDKFRTLWDIGVRTFAVPLDDISYTNWNCQADQDRWGTGGGAAGAAQSYLLNRVNREFIATHPDAQPLQMVPTEYYNVTPSPYKKVLADQLDPDVLVEWTGVGVIAPTMTVDQAKAARTVFGHPILTWDNYPVNDYITNRLLLGPFNGREKGLPGELAGITANPMIQPYASKIALFTLADYAWNDGAYDARASWGAAVKEYAGGDPRATAALRIFADLSYSSDLNRQQAPELAGELASFWASGDGRRLDRTLAALESAPAVLRERLRDRAFADDAGPWLDATEAWGAAARTALRMIGAARDGHGAQAWQLRQELPALVARAQSFTYTGLDGRKIPVLVGDGVLDTFIDAATAEHDRLLGVTGPPKALTSLGTYQTNTPARMVDGDDSTYFWSSGSPAPGDTVTVDLRKQQTIGGITLAMGKPGSVDDYLHDGVLEYSADGTTWQQLAAFSGQATVTASPPAGTTARFVRARATAAQGNWLVVREFAVATARAAVTGGPPAADGSSLQAAADGDVSTVYRAARAPAPGESLDLALGRQQAVRAVTVLRPAGELAKASVQLRTANGSWLTVGSQAGPYTRIETGGVSADAVRLVWSSGASPQIAEVVVG